MRIRAAAIGFALVACTTGEAVEPKPGPPVEAEALATPTGPPPGRVVELDEEDAGPLRDLEVGPDPLVAVGTVDAVWTLNLDDSTVSRIDVDTGEVTAPEVGEAVGVGSDDDEVWIATDARRLVRLDTATGAVEQALTLADRDLFGPRNAGWVVVSGGSVWVTVPPSDWGGGHELWRVDPTDGTVRSRTPIGGDPFPPAVASGAIWMSDSERELVVRVDMATQEVTERDIGSQPGVIAGGAGRVWATRPGALVKLDPRSGRERRTIDLSTTPRGLAWTGGRMWVATDTGVLVIDPATGELVHEVELADPSGDEGPIALVPSDGSVWVTIETA
jgi:sugar lactone lactonase YvrE